MKELSSSYFQEMRRINNIKNKGFYAPFIKIHVDEESEKFFKLSRPYFKSICCCPFCGSTNSDMKYHKYDDTWYCFKCFETAMKIYEARKNVDKKIKMRDLYHLK